MIAIIPEAQKHRSLTASLADYFVEANYQLPHVVRWRFFCLNGSALYAAAQQPDAEERIDVIFLSRDYLSASDLERWANSGEANMSTNTLCCRNQEALSM